MIVSMCPHTNGTHAHTCNWYCRAPILIRNRVIPNLQLIHIQIRFSQTLALSLWLWLWLCSIHLIVVVLNIILTVSRRATIAYSLTRSESIYSLSSIAPLLGALEFVAELMATEPSGMDAWPSQYTTNFMCKHLFVVLKSTQLDI